MNKKLNPWAIGGAVVTVIVLVWLIIGRGTSNDDSTSSSLTVPPASETTVDTEPGATVTTEAGEPVEPHSDDEPDHPEDQMRAIARWTNMMAASLDKEEVFTLINESLGSQLAAEDIAAIVPEAKAAVVADLTGNGRDRFPMLFPQDQPAARPPTFCCENIEWYAVGADAGDTPGSALALVAWHSTTFEGDYIDGVFYLEFVNSGSGWEPVRFTSQPTR